MDIENEITEIKALILKLLSDSKEIMNIKELSAYTGIPTPTIRAKLDTIPRSKQGKRWFFRKSEIDQWLMSNRRKTQEEIEMEASNYVMRNRIR
jgi:predicted DNA-binding transcriptional regulator AlpA